MKPTNPVTTQKIIRKTIARMMKEQSALCCNEESKYYLQTEPHKKISGLNLEAITPLVSQGVLSRTHDNTLITTPEARYWLKRQSLQQQEIRLQHMELHTTTKEENNTRETLTINATESPLYWLRTHKNAQGIPLLGEAEFLAGERLREDYTRASLMPRVTANWEAAINQGRRAADDSLLAFNDMVIAARTRVNKALSAVGPELANVLVDVCCFLKSLPDVEREKNWPQRSGRIILELALKRLARHYGLSPEASGKSKHETRHWGDENYRPQL